ncbi:MAG: thioredoxin-dependent thiol peroxidase [Ignavibacteriae bacterium]|nr:thioredoxin-dependent thiol peroxidase [Ignavibacteriota bacterium]
MNKLKQLFVLVISLFFITACGGNAETLKINEPAPDFTLQDAEGNSYSLADYKGKSPVVIYFYPKASTPGCTKQACGIRDEFDKFKENNITVLGISVDSKESIKEFIDENSLNFPLLSDENKEVSESYGVLNNFGLANRITFIIDKEGNIAKIIRDVDVDTHADEVFEIASGLN